MSLKSTQHLAAGHVPEADRPVQAPCDQQFAICADRQAGHGSFVAAKDLALAAVQVKDLGEIIPPAGDKTFAVGAKGNLIDAAIVVGLDRESGRCRGTRRPEAGQFVEAAGKETLTV